MTAAMEEARRLLYEKAIKKFTLQDVTKHRTIKNKNLMEMLTRYPGYGVGYKVSRKWWPAGHFYHVKNVELYSARYGKLWGILYKDGKIAGRKIEPIEGVLKRGMWNYDLSDASKTEQEVVLDNGVVFNLGEVQKLIDEKKAFLSERKKQMQWIGEPEIELDEAQ